MSLSQYFQDQVRQSLDKLVEERFPDRQILANIPSALDETNQDPTTNNGLISFRTNLNAFDKEFFYEVATSQGVAEYYINAGDRIPQVSDNFDQVTGKQEDIGIGMEYTKRDLERSQFHNQDMIGRKMKSMKRGNDVKLEESFWMGEPTLGFYGLLNFPNVAELSLPADGAGASTTIGSKTPDQKYRDLVTMSLAVSESSQNAYQGDTLLLDLSVFNDVNNSIFGTASDSGQTVLSIFLKNQANNPYGIKRVLPVTFLKQSGSDNISSKAIVYDSSDEVVEGILSEYFAFEMNAGGSSTNFKYSGVASSVTGGTVIYQLLGIVVFDLV